MLIIALNGSFFALFGGMIAAFVNNRYMAYVAPFIFYYVVSTLFDAYLAEFRLINPKEWLMVRSSSMNAVLVILQVINVVVTIGYLKIIQRGCKCD